MGDTSNEILRDWATILALAQFPVYFDPSFEQRLVVFRNGTGEGFEVPDVQPDGSPSCGYLRALETTHDTCAAAEDADYVAYIASDNQEYIAVKIRSRLTFNLEEEQVGFSLLSRLADQQAELRTLEAIPTPSPAELDRIVTLGSEIARSESFLIYLIEIQQQYGISAYFL